MRTSAPKCWLSPLFGLCLFVSFLAAVQNLSQFRGVTIRRTGGFAGGEEEWYFSDKAVRSQAEGVSVQRSEEKLRGLKELVARNYKSRENQAVSIPACFDCFTFRITVWYEDGLNSSKYPKRVARPMPTRRKCCA